jgi:1-acyl-sn-glycerol-3-phosphate acyltransferase
VLPVRVTGERLPPGPAVVVANHACFADCAFLTRISRRRIHVVATVEAFRRSRLLAHVLGGAGVAPVRRCRHDLHLHRTVGRLLTAGAVVHLNVEGEASPRGEYRGALPVPAQLVARLGVPVVPVGISGSYDVGPRWAGVVRRPVTLRVGQPIAFAGRDPEEAIDAAITALLDAPEPALHPDGPPLGRLHRVSPGGDRVFTLRYLTRKAAAGDCWCGRIRVTPGRRDRDGAGPRAQAVCSRASARGAWADCQGMQRPGPRVRPAAAAHRFVAGPRQGVGPGGTRTTMTMPNDRTAASQRQAARIAGLAYVFAILYVPIYLLTSAGLVVAGDPAATIANVQANLALFRVGIVSTLAMFVSVLVLIAALYVTVEPVNRTIALLGLVLRLPEALFGLVSLVFSLLVSQLASGDASLAGFGPQQVQALVQLAVQGGNAAGTVNLVFMALGSLPFLYLFFAARYAPRPLVGFGMLAYVLALASGFTAILAPASQVAGMEMVLVGPVMLFELVFGLWLAIRSIDVPLPAREPRSAGLEAAAETAR